MHKANNLSIDQHYQQRLEAQYCLAEGQCLQTLLPLAQLPESDNARIWQSAYQLVQAIRQTDTSHGGVDALLQEFSLSSNEGIVLMCLAEALLRIPDEATQDALIRDKLSQGKWASHLGQSASLFVNASTWGLLFTGSLVDYSDARKKAQFNTLQRLLGRLGEPVIRRAMQLAMRIMGKQFVLGEHITQALQRAAEKESAGYTYSFDMLGEGARTAADAERYLLAYQQAITAIGQANAGKSMRQSSGISVKLSALYPRYEWRHQSQAQTTLVARLLMLAKQAKQVDISLTVDAEEADRLMLSLAIISEVFRAPELEDWQGFGVAVQAYQKRALTVIDYLAELAQDVGRQLMVRLVKGAYWDSEVKHAQQLGVSDYPVFTKKINTDLSYQACAVRLLSARPYLYPMFATHNAYTVATILTIAGADTASFEFQCLHGMGERLYQQVLADHAVLCRIYAPVGEHRDLLAYLVRRLLENGANSSFVNAIIDKQIPVTELLKNPVHVVQNSQQLRHANLPLPSEILLPRVNSQGWNVQYESDMRRLQTAMPQGPVQTIADTPLNELSQHLAVAVTAQRAWAATAVHKRADCLLKLADLLEVHTPELVYLCIHEAGKTIGDSLDEVREAVDFCRYYAEQAMHLPYAEGYQPLGVVACVSPWNFPLAIFLGQVSAALVTGNTVLAKPAEQTNMIATRCWQLLQAAGIPAGVCQLIYGPGQAIGDRLFSHPEIAAVMFTGSTRAAGQIHRRLAERQQGEVRLIAETGGQNAMLVDSSALLEQVVDAVIQSGLQSAGQRCSALRVLYVQTDIAERLISMLQGAMDALIIGDPSELATDIGPVIDEAAKQRLEKHVARMRQHPDVELLHTVSPPEEGCYFAPHLFAIKNIDCLSEEVFGPCIHIRTFEISELADMVNEINQSGYGLTVGIQSRIAERIDYLTQALAVGNVYVNRNMIGAVVGVQPFGGRGLSGTGPKAGGPNYLRKLLARPSRPSMQAQPLVAGPHTYLSSTPNVRAKQSWRQMHVLQRTALIRQLLAVLIDEQLLADFADDLQQSLATCEHVLTVLEQRLASPLVLPGPTGERNLLMYEARGWLLLNADEYVSFHSWMTNLVAALACGNQVITIVSQRFQVQAELINAHWQALSSCDELFLVAPHDAYQELLVWPQLAGVVLPAEHPFYHATVLCLANRSGAIIPVLSDTDHVNLATTLLLEKTISTDTTAAGGNTRLMTLNED